MWGVISDFIYPQPKILILELAADSIISTLLDKFVHAVLYYDYESSGELSEEEKKLRRPSKGDKKLIELLPDNYKENYKFEVNKLKDQCVVGMEEKLAKEMLELLLRNRSKKSEYAEV